MSKRTLPAAEKHEGKKSTKHWSLGLLESMKNPREIYKESKNIVVIRDKYPKAKIHYLMLPRDDIKSIHHLNKSHLNLLEEFGTLLEDIKKDHADKTLKAGFHAIPSMQRLHMHIISTDMISQCLKTKVHWNSFTTDFFMPYQVVLSELKQTGSIAKIYNDSHKTFMATPLKCNQCDFVAQNMPRLKEHLLGHVK